jgi:hypothetical protein
VDRPLARLDVDLGDDVSLPPARPSGSAIAISPDGTRLVYVSDTAGRAALFTRRLDQARATELPATQGADYPFFSQDGQWVGFTVRDKLMKISVEGGAAVPVGDVYNFGNASWGEDGKIIASEVFGKGLVVHAAAGGAVPQALPGLGTAHAAFAPQVLPGGRGILFSLAQATGDVNAVTIEVLTRTDGQRKVVARGGTSARYVSAPCLNDLELELLAPGSLPQPTPPAAGVVPIRSMVTLNAESPRSAAARKAWDTIRARRAGGGR